MLDIAVSYNRYQFLGHEFLTWLWFQIEKAHPELVPDGSRLEIGNRLVMQNRSGESLETVTITGDAAGLEEGILALKKGALVSELNLKFSAGEHIWHFTLKGESLGISGLKLSASFSDKSTEDAVIEKYDLLEETVAVIQQIYRRFILLRVSDRWQGEIVPALKEWIADQPRRT